MKSLLEKLSDDGKVIVVTNQRFLIDDRTVEDRRFFVENGNVEAIIRMPDELFGGEIEATTMIVLGKNNHKISFVDARKLIDGSKGNYYLSEENVETIFSAIQFETNISKKREIRDVVESGSKLGTLGINIDCPRYVSIPLCEVVRSIHRGAKITSKEFEKRKTESATDLRCITPADFQDGVIDSDIPYLHLDKVLPYTRGFDETRFEKFILQKGDILLNKNGKPYRTVLYDGNEECIASENLFIIRVDDEEKAYYLQAFFQSDNGRKLIESCSKKSTKLTSLNIQELGKMVIPIPTDEEEIKRVVSRYKAINKRIGMARREIRKCSYEINEMFE